MRAIKNVVVVFILACFLNSCVVISYYPFFTKDLIYFEPKLIGKWLDPKYKAEKGSWEVQKFEDFLLDYHLNPYAPLENNKGDQNRIDTELYTLDDAMANYKSDLERHDSYKNSYAITHKAGETATIFLATPFKISNQLFLDLMPIYQSDCSNNKDNNDTPFFKAHLVTTHSLVRLNLKSNNMVYFDIIDEWKLSELIEAHKIKIRHEKATNAYDYEDYTTAYGVGYEDYLLLTATSEELVKFIKNIPKMMING